MTTTAIERSTLIAVFTDHEQANKAIDDLRHAGYSYDQIRLVQRGSNSFMENFKSLFSQTAATTSSPDDWMRIGMTRWASSNCSIDWAGTRMAISVKPYNLP